MKTFYRLDMSRVTFREYAFDNSWLLTPLVAVFKLLRLQLPGSSDDPPVESLAPFEVEETALPAEIRARFEPLTREFAELGFRQPIYHQIYCGLQFTYVYWATFVHASGRSVARIHHRVWSHGLTHRSYLFPIFISELNDGSFLVSSAGKPDFIAPKSVHIHYMPAATATELSEAHDRRLDTLLPCQPIYADSQDRVRDLIERHHGVLRDFHLARGVFKPVSDTKQAELAEHAEVTLATTTGASVEQDVLARLQSTQQQKPGWGNFVLILAISLLAFLAAGLTDMNREFLWLLVPILLFHELGHYVAMRVFGYRNVRMFFIPFLGAAVTGKHYNVAGWKKAVVALAGPVPGIVVGAGVGVCGLLLHQPKLTDAAMLMMILNGINLLPFMPLDGGWVLHAVIFCRHPLLDLAARVLAVLAFFGVAYLLGGRLYLLGILMLIGLPAAWRSARVAHRLRRRKEIAVSSDDVSIPPETAGTILAELGAGRHTRVSANVLVLQVTSVFETLNARPPGILGSGALLALHGGSFLAALVFAVIFAVFRHGLTPEQLARAATPPPYRYSAGNKGQWQGAAAPALLSPSSITLVVTYPDKESAQAQFGALPAELPREARMALFGQSLLVTVPEDDGVTPDVLTIMLRQKAMEVTAGRKDHALMFRFSCDMPSADAAQELTEELQHYFHFANSKMLLPPWSAAWQGLPEAERQRFQKARRTLGRLGQIKKKAHMNPEVRALAKDLPKVAGSGDEIRLRQAWAPYLQAIKAEEERLLAAIAAEGEASVDHAMIGLWQQQTKMMGDLVAIQDETDDAKRKPKAEAHRRDLTALHRKMAERMGALPLAKDQSKPGSDLESASNALVRREDRVVSIDGVSFRQPGNGLPAFAEWLCRRTAVEIRYGVEAIDMGDPEEGEEEP